MGFLPSPQPYPVIFIPPKVEGGGEGAFVWFQLCAHPRGAPELFKCFKRSVLSMTTRDKKIGANFQSGGQ